MQPWHLKVELALFDANGKPNQQGTFEEWWAGPDQYRAVYSLPTYTATTVRDGSDAYQTKEAAAPPVVAATLVSQLLHPMPDADALQGTVPELRTISSGKTPLACIMLTQPTEIVAPPLGLFPTFCFDSNSNRLRVTFDFGLESVIRDRIESFEGKTIATELTLALGRTILGTAKVVTLEPTDEAAAKIVPDAELEKETGAQRAELEAKQLIGSSLTKVAPIYPVSAKKKHLEGSVVLKAVIGRDGQIRHLRLISANDADLALSAIAAVRQWTYKPYRLNGVAVDVDTTITVNFRMGPG